MIKPNSAISQFYRAFLSEDASDGVDRGRNNGSLSQKRDMKHYCGPYKSNLCRQNKVGVFLNTFTKESRHVLQCNAVRIQNLMTPPAGQVRDYI